MLTDKVVKFSNKETLIIEGEVASMWPFKHSNNNSKDLKDALEAWLMGASESVATYRAYHRALELWQESVGTKFDDAKESHAIVFIRNLQGKEGYASTTVSQFLVSLSGLYNSLLRQGLVKRNPFPFVKNKIRKGDVKERPGVLVPTEKIREALALLSQSKADEIRDACVIALMYGGGLRIGELSLLNIDDIKSSEDRALFVNIKASNAKGRKHREVSLAPWSYVYVQRWQELRKASVDSKNYLISKSLDSTYHLSVEQIRRRVKAIFKLVGVKMTPHNLRASAITHFRDQGIPAREIKGWSGHSSEAVIEKNYDKRKFESEAGPWSKMPDNFIFDK